MGGGMSIRSWAMMVLVVLAVVLGMWEMKMANAAVTPAQCAEEKRLGINACKSVLNGMSPSAECCQRVRVSSVECICPAISPRLAARIGLNRFIRGVEGCGRKLPSHYTCGAFTIP